MLGYVRHTLTVSARRALVGLALTASVAGVAVTPAAAQTYGGETSDTTIGVGPVGPGPVVTESWAYPTYPDEFGCSVGIESGAAVNTVYAVYPDGFVTGHSASGGISAGYSAAGGYAPDAPMYQGCVMPIPAGPGW
jgi:hypothetical protein